MRSEAELGQAIEDAKQAEAIVNHPLFIAALKSLRVLTVDKFESLGFDQTKEMQECNMRMALIQEFEGNIMTVIQSGNVAFQALEDIQTHQKAMNNER